MGKHFYIELIGYVASALIAISMMLSSILRLRLVNLAGAAAFAVYGLLIGSVPVAVLNGLIVAVNAQYLLRMLRAKEYFHLLSLRPDSDYLSYFLGFHAKDIHGFFPEFTHRPGEKQVALFILRDCTPAGVFIAEEHPDGVLRVVLDYAVRSYRDFKIGRFLFVEQADFFRRRGIKEIVVLPRTADFGAYLIKVGFEPAGDEHGSFRIRYADRAG
jgi:hypothetical protein